MEYIYYNIAGHRFAIHTPNLRVTRSLIPSLEPFLYERKGDNNETLFSFFGNKKIVTQHLDPVDIINLDSFSFKVFIENESLTVCMKDEFAEYNFLISEDRNVVYSDLSLTDKREANFINYFLRTVFGILSAYHKTLKIHASVIEKNGKALIFLGKSGTGKSTHSKLWQKFVPGCSLLNDDEPIIRFLSDGTVRVFGAPWSGSTPCYRNISAEVCAFVHLHQSAENSLTKLNGLTAFSSLLQSTAIMRSDRNNRSLVISVINDILEKIPVYRLDNRPDRDAVALTETLLV